MHPANELRNLRRRVARARENAPFTCSASRHVQGMAEELLAHGRAVLPTREDCNVLAESMLATVEALWKARTELAKRRGE